MAILANLKRQAEKHIANSSILTVFIKVKQTNKAKPPPSSPTRQRPDVAILVRFMGEIAAEIRGDLIHYVFFWGC